MRRHVSFTPPESRWMRWTSGFPSPSQRLWLYGQWWIRQPLLRDAASEERRKSPTRCPNFTACVSPNESNPPRPRLRGSHILELPHLIRRCCVQYDLLMTFFFFLVEAVVPFVFISRYVIRGSVDATRQKWADVFFCFENEEAFS